ncbi:MULTISPECIES: 4-hydroxy-tetrahydrodipicolinate reductase [Aeribacillus]|jgi:4-hydroxy-tetrahydrodipicolinate reductase|uniref:4-hydroxy-tetrahydrodipicolinate reductase n=2 Tax=Aeribacillus TaxID=1055323 RepID=A0A223E8Z2_9BACI|nr:MULTISPECIES: 4-hydroxy-tetrahydrodipicolinate reductase [Aeribacillus]ASS91716.1 4-hydroxy-tetrahydrodipicolinate reductase [Aeribacillus pallidus]MDR9792939.1 4-hydroxy-tetrahydrodipicolinate reductase [Aeribacillus pallidus]MED0648973.1 4-hydroxy-tetrahydrodipicolinate reductase [Aeribacillus composti]MED0702962.1 4-hydroxy-tetrahydrodipicolinate reductase [Aeribacillus composti]MED4486048.1 4-hydroxy-tetrahydrodipicolinate reductase [Aeribacillus pallidus]
MEQIKIVIAGPRGRMGQEAVKLVNETEHFTLSAVIDKINDGEWFQDQVRTYTNPEQCFAETSPDVLIDLTTPEVGKIHTKLALEHGVRPVVGTTGFQEEDLQELRKLAEEKGIGAIIAPNFAIGAVLMMKFAKMAARYFPDVEIIEMHHDKKLDAPSGTGIKTAEMIYEVRGNKKQGHPEEKETIKGARGGEWNGIHIHSVRLPGLVAHQEVLFGGDGQTLKIRHDSYNRASFMSGVKLSVETVMKIDTLVYGLENIIE